MKIKGTLLGALVVAAALGGTVGAVPTANAMTVSTSCAPIGGGWAQCTQTLCVESYCYVVDSWQQPISEAIVES